MNGQVPRDVIEYQLLADEPIVELEVVRGGVELEVTVVKQAGEPLGLEVSAAIFDRVRTCDNHCEFCFIYQLPKGMRRNLYVKDDDYRLSFLYGNFTTLTRFTEVDLERVVDQHLSPLYVSIHATDPEVRSAMLRNRRGAISLQVAPLPARQRHRGPRPGRGLPGVNDGAVLARDPRRRPRPLSRACDRGRRAFGVSRYSKEPTMRAHTRRGEDDRRDGAGVAGTLRPRPRRRVVWASDEYYLLAGRGVARGRRLRRFPTARERCRDGARVRAVLRGRRLRTRDPGAFRPGPGSSPGSRARRPRATAPRARAVSA